MLQSQCCHIHEVRKIKPHIPLNKWSFYLLPFHWEESCKRKNKFRRIKKGKGPAKLEGREENEPYFTCWGLIIQEDVSILSVCATNNRCRKIQRLRSMMTSINESSKSMYKKNSSIRCKLQHKGRNQHMWPNDNILFVSKNFLWERREQMHIIDYL